jgi:hypothetical protein
MIGLLRRPWGRAGTGALTSAAVLGALVVLGPQDGNHGTDVNLLSGSAWLSSGRVGQVTLLDGPTAEVAAQVQVAPVGDVLQLAQQGSDVYVVNQSAGSVRLVDGATLRISDPAYPLQGAGAGLTAFAGPNSLYALDTRRGVFTSANPKTGRAEGQPQSMAAQVAPNTAGIDDQGRLWIMDDSSGDLFWAEGNKGHRVRGVTQPGRSLLTIAHGKPVVVDTLARRAFAVDPDTATPGNPIDLDVRPNEEVQVSGSPHQDQVYVVTPRGVLAICDLTGMSCGRVVPLASASSRLGAAVEAGNRVFVPDYSTGQVWVVDLANGNVVAKPKVLDQAKQFQLFTRDGEVFYNDPDSAQSGVIRLDGTVQSAAKFDPANPKKGLSHPVDATDVSEQPTTTATDGPLQQPGPTGGGTTTATNPPDTSTQQPPPPPPSYVPPPSPGDTSTPPPPTSETSTPPPKPVIRITPSKASPAVNEPITLMVDDTNGVKPQSATWTFGDGQTGSAAMVSHQWATAQSYHVSVQAKMPDGQDAETSRTIDVTPPPVTTVPVVIGRTQSDATAALTAASLRVTVSTVASNTVASGRVIAQNPAGGTKAAPQTIVNITVSSGKPAKVDLLANGGSAQWHSGAGTLKWDGDDGDVKGFVKPRSGWLMEDGSAPAFLETHPQWVANGYTEGTYTVRAIIAGDHFRTTVGFMAVKDAVSKGAGTFKVQVTRPNGTTTTIATVNDTAADGVMRPIDVDLTPYAGSTKVRLHVDAGPDAVQDWMSWVAPRIEG